MKAFRSCGTEFSGGIYMKRLIALISALLLCALTALPALADGTAYTSLYIIPDSDSRALTETELWGYSRETLRYIRNEILARGGYAFSMDKFYNYFNAKPWYQAGGYGSTKTLSTVAWNNITLVKKVERAMDKAGTQNAAGLDIKTIIEGQNKAGGYGDQVNFANARGVGNGLTAFESTPLNGRVDQTGRTNTTPSQNTTAPISRPATPAPHYIYTAQYIIPDSDIRALTEGELWAYSRETLRYIRNEILARHGYSFNKGKFADYFKAKDWYQPGGYDPNKLNKTEWDNVSLIKKVERTMDALGAQNKSYLDITTIIENQKNGTCPGQ